MIVVLAIVGYAGLSLHQRSNCAQAGGAFLVGLPNVCQYPPGSPQAAGTPQAIAYCAAYDQRQAVCAQQLVSTCSMAPDDPLYYKYGCS